MEIRDYQIEDGTGLGTLRVIFFNTAYYDIVAREKERYQHPSIELVAVENEMLSNCLILSIKKTKCYLHST